MRGTRQQPSLCGDGFVEGVEECDDGNKLTGDGCSLDCRTELGPFYANAILGTAVAGPGVTEPEHLINGIGGGYDVFSLGYSPENSRVALYWKGLSILDGPGDDFVVFENGFQIGDSDNFFMDHLVVEVSSNGEEWLSFPYDYTALEETSYQPKREYWQGFAGVNPVYFREEQGGDPFNFEVSGGDGFDISELGLTSISYVRLTTAPSLTISDTGMPFVRDGISNGADIDGIYGRYLVNNN